MALIRFRIEEMISVNSSISENLDVSPSILFSYGMALSSLVTSYVSCTLQDPSYTFKALHDESPHNLNRTNNDVWTVTSTRALHSEKSMFRVKPRVCTETYGTGRLTLEQ